ncbi:MAG: HAD family hydrolase, partial [Pseudomonadota bacterium]
MTRRIAMWSGPRNISTTMMRSFENRADTAVTDEPLYAHYLTVTGHIHPMQEDILSAQSGDWREVVAGLTTDTPAPVWFQKHMTQHITPNMDLGWLASLDHFFLIRDPRLMAPSFLRKMGTARPEDLGLDQELVLFREVERLTGKAPPVVDANDVLNNPEAVLTKL